jgi:aconitase B
MIDVQTMTSFHRNTKRQGRGTDPLQHRRGAKVPSLSHNEKGDVARHCLSLLRANLTPGQHCSAQKEGAKMISKLLVLSSSVALLASQNVVAFVPFIDGGKDMPKLYDGWFNDQIAKQASTAVSKAIGSGKVIDNLKCDGPFWW